MMHAAELLAKLEGMLTAAPTVNVGTMNVTNNTVVLVQAAIIQALQRFLEARAAVTKALERIEHENGGGR